MFRIIKTENQPRNLPAYVAKLAQNGDLAALLDRVRAGEATRPAPGSTPVPPSWREQLALPPCPHGMPGGHRERPSTGTPACPACRAPSAPPRPVRPPPATDRSAALASLRESLAGLTPRSEPRRAILPAVRERSPRAPNK